MDSPRPHRSLRSPTGLAALLALWLWGGAVLAAGPSKLEYSIAAVSPLAQKRLESVQDFLAAGQWSEAFSVIEEVQREHRRALVEAEPGRWIGVSRRIAEITAGLPAEGLGAYCRRVEAQADSLRREAEQGEDSAAWRRLLDEFFVTPAGAEALWRLGRLHWEEGDPAGARELWSSLLPPDNAGPVSKSLRHPDPGYAEEVVLARLTLCDLLLGEPAAAKARLARLRERFPESRGTVGGREGNYVDLLTSLVGDAADPPRTPPWLGGSGGQGGPFRRIGAPLWSLPLSETPSTKRFGIPPVTQVPALLKNLCVVADNRRVLALRADSGKPAWPTGARQDNGSIFEGDADPRTAARWPAPLHRPAIDSEGRCFVRIGIGAQPNQLSLLKNDTSRIVALDLGRGEGRLLWSTLAGELATGPAAIAWGFASSPIVVDGRTLVVVRSPGTEAQCGVACLSAATGDLLWLQPVATVISEADPLWGRESLRHGSGRVVLNLDGLVASLRLADGRLEWCVRRVAEEAGFVKSGSSRETATLQPLVAGGRVYGLWGRGASGGSSEVLALDLSDGKALWRGEGFGQLESAIAIRRGVLAVAGETLWGIDAVTGARRWKFGFDDPAARGAGPGVALGDDLLWATREDLFTIDIVTGEALHRLPLAEQTPHRQGGWLEAGGREFILAAPHSLNIFSLTPQEDR